MLDEGKTVSAVARELDLTASALRVWVERARADRSKGKTGLTTLSGSLFPGRGHFSEAGAARFEEAPAGGAGQLRRADFGKGVATVLSLDGNLVHASLFAS